MKEAAANIATKPKAERNNIVSGAVSGAVTKIRNPKT
jgi:hypothetical protein